MGCAAVNPSKTWKAVLAKRRENAVYRITLLVRGKEVIREFTDETLFRKWKSTYESQMRRNGDGGIERMHVDVIYR